MELLTIIAFASLRNLARGRERTTSDASTDDSRCTLRAIDLVAHQSVDDDIEAENAPWLT
jgi:hypothetical protein